MDSLPTLTTEMAAVMGIIVIAVMILGGGLDRTGIMDRVAAAILTGGVREFCVNKLRNIMLNDAKETTDCPVTGWKI